jgi:membrane protein implicated in regulation of membrane protease activity
MKKIIGLAIALVIALLAIAVAAMLLGGLQSILGNRVYNYLFIALLVVSLVVYLRNRWRDSQQHYRTHIAPENELQALEEMAGDYAQGRYDNRQYIEKVIDSVEKTHEPSVILARRLESVRDALIAGDVRRR